MAKTNPTNEPVFHNSFVRISVGNREALESVIRDVIKIRLNRRIATRSGEGNQPLNIKTVVERPISKQGFLFYFSLHPPFLNVFL